MTEGYPATEKRLQLSFIPLRGKKASAAAAEAGLSPLQFPDALLVGRRRQAGPGSTLARHRVGEGEHDFLVVSSTKHASSWN